MKKSISSLLIVFTLTSFMSFLSVPTPAKAEMYTPVPRDQTLIIEINPVAYFTVFDKANPFIPSGTQWGSGWHQAVQEWDWYINYATGEIILWRITGWKYSADYRVFTLYVRRGVTWNDGYPYTSKDIAFTLNMLLTHPTLEGSPYVREWVDHVETPDDYTAVIYLKKANPRFHHAFRMWGYIPYIAAEHIWKDVDPETFANWPPVDTGPYKLYGVYPELPMFIWERRDDYWGKEVGVFPAPKYLIWRGIPPADIDLEDFVKGDVDVVLPHAFTWEMIKTAMTRTPNITIAPYPDPCPYGINSFNVAKYPFNITEFRWAIAYLINREKLAKMYALSNGTWPTYWLLPMPYSWSVFDKYKTISQRALQKIESELGFKLEYNPNKAKEILDSIGFVDKNGDGWRDYPNGTRIATIELLFSDEEGAYYIGYDLVEELKAIGIDATTKMGGALTFELSALGYYDIRICTECSPGWLMVDPVATLDIFHSKWYVPIGNTSGTPGIQGANPRYRNSRLDELIDALEAVPLDAPNVPSLLEEAFYIVQRDCITVPAVEKMFVQTFNTKYWVGWPSEKDMYIVPYNWWPSFFFVLAKIRPAKEAIVTPPAVNVTEVVSELSNRIDALSNRVVELSNKVDALSGQVAGITSTTMGLGAITIILAIVIIVLLLHKK